MKKIFNFQFSIFNSRKGFTLIELLIVIAIIGVLSTLLMANFVGVRQRARDSQRKSDLRQIQAALEIYRSDIGRYPDTLKNCNSISLGNADNNCNIIYMQKIPSDPSGSGYNSGNYFYSSPDGANYTLGACLENSGDGDRQDSSIDPTGGSGGTCSSQKYYVLNSP